MINNLERNYINRITLEININEVREINSIKLKINDKLVDYISKEKWVSINDLPSSFMLRNVWINTLNLDIVVIEVIKITKYWCHK